MLPATLCGTGVGDGVGDGVGVRVVHGKAVRVDEGDGESCAAAYASVSASARGRAQRRIPAARHPADDTQSIYEEKALRWILSLPPREC